MHMQRSSEVLAWRPLIEWAQETGKLGLPPVELRHPRTAEHLISDDERYVVAYKDISDPASVWAVYEASGRQRVLGLAGTREGALQEAEIIEVARRISGVVMRSRALVMVGYARALRRAAGIYLAIRTVRRARGKARNK